MRERGGTTHAGVGAKIQVQKASICLIDRPPLELQNEIEPSILKLHGHSKLVVKLTSKGAHMLLSELAKDS